MRSLSKSHVSNELAVAHDGEEALDYIFRKGKYAERVPGNPVLILLHLKMPKIDGLEVLKRIKFNETTKNIPVVIFTSSKEEIDIVTSYNMGCNAFVRKPIEFGEFAEAIKILGLFWKVLNKLPPNEVSVK